MYIVSRTARFVRGALLSYGPRSLKRYVWNKEFAQGTWNFIDNTAGDCVYPILGKYAQNGSILDLGCGPGNTANEMDANSYSNYLGVDISEEALAKAVHRSNLNGRAEKNRFAAGDLISYKPEGRFDVILFRESMYHVPMGKIKPLLEKYSRYLTDRGVFVVRMYIKYQNGESARRPTRMIEVIEKAFRVLERGHDSNRLAAVIVFKPRTHV